MKRRGDWCYRFFFLTGLHFFLALSLKINSPGRSGDLTLPVSTDWSGARSFSFFSFVFVRGGDTASPEDYLASLIAADYSTSLGIYGREFAKHRGTILFPSLS